MATLTTPTTPLQSIAVPPATGTAIVPGATSAAPTAPGESPETKAYIQKMIALTKKVCPDATDKAINKCLPAILKALASAGLTSKNQLIGFVATVYVETVVFDSIPEYATGDDYEGRDDLGNNQPGDGRKYKGRGFIQITGRSNYTALSKKFNVDLVGNPDLLLKDIALCASSNVWWWKEHKVDVEAAKADWLWVRKIVNGGTNGWDVYEPAIKRGLQYYTEDINAALVAQLQLGGDYGLGCMDGGSGPTRQVTGGGVTSQADALSRALGLSSLDASKAITFHALINAAEYPELVDLSPQKTFELQNFGDGLNGTLTVEEVKHYYGSVFEIEIWAHMPDPNAPQPQLFRSDANSPLNGNTGTPGNVPSGPTPTGAIGAVPYASQRDNPSEPDRTCNTYASWMCGAFLGMKCTPIEYYNKMRTYGDSTSHEVQAQTLDSFGIKAQFLNNMSFERLDAELAKKRPSVLGINHRGSLENPTGGHMIAVIGKTASGDYIVHDPYGDLNTDYSNRDGAGKVYTRSVLTRRWLMDGPGTGWGRIFP
jgi:predicted chitinase